MAGNGEEIARALYDPFAAGDREFFEEHLAEELTFSSPPDPELDREGFFERIEVYFGWDL
jgi:ketosteroid isomerase-like protein